jgi:predicted aspartyl protease
MDWNRLDDYTFVKLVGDLLGRLGFVDIDYQGDGPDGGIDLFATELLPFTVQGRTPFRWAIQCKFSSDPQNKSVNDKEVRDVEGILRSERYASQNLRGYMLVTNRQIVQNVVERLRGVDRHSQYRAARLDGGQIESILSEHPEVEERYFRDQPGAIGLGRPVIIVPRPPRGFSGGEAGGDAALIPLVITVGADSDLRSVHAEGIVDTGASITCVPTRVLVALGATKMGKITVSTPAATNSEVFTYLVSISIEHLLIRKIIVIGLEFDYVLLGRDALKEFTVVLDPSGTVRLFDSAK